jgi:hypothetical protein
VLGWQLHVKGIEDGGRRMRVPDIGAIHGPRGGDDRQFLDAFGKGALVAWLIAAPFLSPELEVGNVP